MKKNELNRCLKKNFFSTKMSGIILKFDNNAVNKK